MLDPKNIFPIGMGTWGIGGFAERNPRNDDEKQVEALTHMLEKGVNMVEATYWYAQGKAVELFNTAVKNSRKMRDELFITSTIYPYNNPTLTDAEKELEVLLKTLNTNYLDSVLFSLSSLSQWGREDAKRMLHKFLNSKKVRFISVTNFDLESLKEFQKEFEASLFSHELTFSFEIRENFDFGITSFADENNIRNIIFQPLRRNRTSARNWPLLVELANKYSKTQNQIILNWIVSKGFIPLTKSEAIEHINEHLDSLNFKIDLDDLKKLVISGRPIGKLQR